MTAATQSEDLTLAETIELNERIVAACRRIEADINAIAPLTEEQGVFQQRALGGLDALRDLFERQLELNRFDLSVVGVTVPQPDSVS